MAKNENEMAMANGSEKAKLMLEREPFFGTDKKQYFAYILKGKVRGKEIKVDFAGADKGSYEVLDIVFDTSKTAELIMHDEKMTDDKTGEIKYYTIYEAQNIDEDGCVYSAGIKPSRKSDKDLLAMLLCSLK